MYLSPIVRRKINSTAQRQVQSNDLKEKKNKSSVKCDVTEKFCKRSILLKNESWKHKQCRYFFFYSGSGELMINYRPIVARICKYCLHFFKDESYGTKGTC